MHGLAFYAFAYLATAVIAVIISRRIGLGTVVGYVAAGVIIGPILQVSTAGSEYLEQFSEFGIIMMLFLIGLEIDPQRVWRLRAKLLGLGGLQVVGTLGVVTAIGTVVGFTWQQSLLFGFVGALSSTAIVLQTLEETGLLESDGGQAGFAVLLFQDFAVIPMLASIPLIAGASTATSAGHDTTLLQILPGWAAALLTLSAVAFVGIAGQYLSRPVFRLIALLRLREIFTAMALLVVVAIALLMSAVGLSPALGAFLAGIMLANSEFKHELQNDVEPFKGLLLGLFFMTIGAKVDLAVLRDNWQVILAATLALIAIKIAVLLPLGWLFRVRGAAGWLFALGLAQAGEFGFVLLSIGRERQLLTEQMTSVAILVITMGMILTPVLFALYDRIAMLIETQQEEAEADKPDEGTIIIAGVGRFGQIINRMLLANGHKTVILDYRADVVDDIRRFGVKSFFGDASRPDLLTSAGLEKADLLLVAIDDRHRATAIVAHARQHNPTIRIIARAYDRLHHYELAEAGADHIVRELFGSSVEAAGLALQSLGMHPYEVEKRKNIFIEEDVAGLVRMAPLVDEAYRAHENPMFVNSFNNIAGIIENAMRGERAGYEEIVRRGWSPPDLGKSHAADPASDRRPEAKVDA